MTGLLDFPLQTSPAAGPGHDDASLVPEVVPAGNAGPATAPAPLVLLEGDRMGQGDQMLAALAHAFRVARRRARDLSEREGGLVRGLAGGQAPSVREQHAYAAGRTWVPPGHDGGLLEGMGAIYHWLVGRPGVALGQAIAAVSARPLRWCIGAVISLACAVIALLAAGHPLAAILAGAGAAILTTAWGGAGYLLMRLADAHAPRRDDDETGDE
jgi:hypothetical protein